MPYIYKQYTFELKQNSMNTTFAEIVTIGDEILYGQITDTNSQWISAELDKIGVKTIRKSSVGDDKEQILNILQEASQRADIILMTGGLGPTKDDITKKTLAEFFNTEMEINETALAQIEQFFKERELPILETNRQQAAIPSNATYITNREGTAPGMWFEQNGKIFISMPGVPREMKVLMEEQMIPRIQEFFQTPVIFHRIIKTFGKGESQIADIIQDWEDNLPENIKLAYLPNYGHVRLRLTGIGQDEETLKKQVFAEEEKVTPLIQKYIYGYDHETLEENLGELLVKHHKTVSTAESCTGGYLAHLFTKVPGSSRYLMGGIVAYSNEIKMNRLGVKEETLKEHGAVSEATIREMAENVREKFGTDIGVASSGVAGPGGGSKEKPVGTVWIAYADKNGTYSRKLMLTPNRQLNITVSANVILDLIRKKVTGIID